MHRPVLLDEQRELGTADRRLGVGGDLREHVVELQLRDEVLHRGHQQVGDLGLLADLQLHQPHPRAAAREIAREPATTAITVASAIATGTSEGARSAKRRAGQQRRRRGDRLRSSAAIRVPVDVEDALGIAAADAARVADPRRWAAEHHRPRREQADVVVAVARVVGGAEERAVADPRVVRADLEGVHPVDAVELRARPADVREQQPRGAEGPQGELQRDADVGVQRRGAHPIGDVGVVEDVGGRVEEVDAEPIREPAVVVAELRLAIASARRARAAPRPPCRPALPLHVGDREAASSPR